MLGVSVGHRLRLRLKLARIRFRRLGDRPLRLAQPVKGVGQRDGVEIVLVVIFHDRRIDIEHHRHLARFAGLQALLREAEAVDLVEISSDGRRRNVVGRLPAISRAASLTTL